MSETQTKRSWVMRGKEMSDTYFTVYVLLWLKV
jgi:hypothetical protein